MFRAPTFFASPSATEKQNDKRIGGHGGPKRRAKREAFGGVPSSIIHGESISILKLNWTFSLISWSLLLASKFVVPRQANMGWQPLALSHQVDHGHKLQGHVARTRKAWENGRLVIARATAPTFTAWRDASKSDDSGYSTVWVCLQIPC